MSDVPIRSTTQPDTRMRWLKPVPLWESADADMTKPYIAEFKTDDFLSDFLAMMKGKPPPKLTPPQDKDAAGKWKLYQPLLQRYYLVTGSLVCSQGGTSDQPVVRKKGERTSFVLRRMVKSNDQEQEQGWIKDGQGWQPLVDEEKSTLRQDEERLPLYSVQTSIPGEPRKVYYGNIPTVKCEKYLNVAPPPTTDTQQTATESFFVVRLVYEHAPYAPVVSEASEPFTFATYYPKDPNAPTREIRIETPNGGYTTKTFPP